MDELYKIVLIGISAGVLGTFIGVLINTVCEKNRIKTLISGGLTEFASGLAIAIVCFDLLPEAFILNGIKNSVIGIFAGIVAMLLIRGILGGGGYNGKKATYILLISGFFIHNLPEGIGIGASYLVDYKLTHSLVLIAFLCNIPKMMSDTSKWHTLIPVSAAGLALGLGTVLGMSAGRISNNALAFCLSLSAGAMIYLRIGGFLKAPEGMQSGRLSTMFNILGIISGIVITVL